MRGAGQSRIVHRELRSACILLHARRRALRTGCMHAHMHAAESSGSRCRRASRLGTAAVLALECPNPPYALGRAPSVYPFIQLPSTPARSLFTTSSTRTSASKLSCLFSILLPTHAYTPARPNALPHRRHRARSAHAHRTRDLLTHRNTILLSFTLVSSPIHDPKTTANATTFLTAFTNHSPQPSASRTREPPKPPPSPNSNAQAGNAPRSPALPPSGDYLPFHARRFVVPTSTLRPTLTTLKHRTAHRQKYPPFRAWHAS